MRVPESLCDTLSALTASARSKPSTIFLGTEADRRDVVVTLLARPTPEGLSKTSRIVPTRRSWDPPRRSKSLYFLRHERILPLDRELRIPDRLLRRRARDDGNPVPERGDTSRLRGPGPARSPRPQWCHSLRCPRGYRRQPDR